MKEEFENANFSSFCFLPSSLNNILEVKMNRKRLANQTKRATLPISIGCSSDAPGIERALINNRGILKVYANPVTEMLYVEYDPTLIDQENIMTLIKRAGFGLVNEKRDYVFDKSAARG